MERPPSQEPLVGGATGPVEVRIVAAVDSDNVIAFEGDDDLPWEFDASGQLERIARKVAGHTVVVGGPAAPRLRALFSKSHVIVMDARATFHREVPVIETVDDALAQCPPGRRLYVTGNNATLQIFMPYATRVDLYALDVPLARQDGSGAARNEPERFPPMPTPPLLVVGEPNPTQLRLGLPFRRVSHELDPIVCTFLGDFRRIPHEPVPLACTPLEDSAVAPPDSGSFDGGKIVRAAQRDVLLDTAINESCALAARVAKEEEAAMVEMAIMQSFYETGQSMQTPAKDADWDEFWCDGEEEEDDFDHSDAESDDPDAAREANAY
ncbi:Dihydrofolate reductase domain-containing protein [Pandoravirus kuranda]|uniref:Dihydrofolate reductase domain-containing protein n=1 Tax=Pandoravirus kuranda TaxID=3019033 RepID=A0AA95EH33_9VIRU|nr:Dihydrofolate reductase domain-containing protein [Pandoravirus kuranda]